MTTARLKGKRAVVTAGAAGIGRATAERLAAEGAEVIATDLQAVQFGDQSGSLRSVVVDAVDRHAVAAFFAEAGPLDILVNCVGYVHQGNILECSYEEWVRSMEINVESMFHAVRAVLPGMVDRGNGSIVNIASIASSVKGVPNRAAYSASKAAVIGLTKSIAVDFVGQGVRCNAICPGTVLSPSLEDRINSFEDPQAARAAFIARQPMNRLGSPEEIAAAAAYFASDESRFATGAVFVIDGGYSL